MAFIHENQDWPRFSWDAAAVLPALGRARLKQGLLLGRMQHLRFDLRSEAVARAGRGRSTSYRLAQPSHC